MGGSPIIAALSERRPLDPRHVDHALKGEWVGCRDCHIEPDWLLIYETDDDILTLQAIGTHSDLFGRRRKT